MGEIIETSQREDSWEYFAEAFTLEETWEAIEKIESDAWTCQEDLFNWYQTRDKAHLAYEYKTLQFHQSAIDDSLKMTGGKKEERLLAKRSY